MEDFVTNEFLVDELFAVREQVNNMVNIERIIEWERENKERSVATKKAWRDKYGKEYNRNYKRKR